MKGLGLFSYQSKIASALTWYICTEVGLQFFFYGYLLENGCLEQEDTLSVTLLLFYSLCSQLKSDLPKKNVLSILKNSFQFFNVFLKSVLLLLLLTVHDQCRFGVIYHTQSQDTISLISMIVDRDIKLFVQIVLRFQLR